MDMFYQIYMFSSRESGRKDVFFWDHFSTTLPLMVFYLCHFGQQSYIKVNGEFGLFSPSRGRTVSL